MSIIDFCILWWHMHLLNSRQRYMEVWEFVFFFFTFWFHSSFEWKLVILILPILSILILFLFFPSLHHVISGELEWVWHFASWCILTGEQSLPCNLTVFYFCVFISLRVSVTVCVSLWPSLSLSLYLSVYNTWSVFLSPSLSWLIFLPDSFYISQRHSSEAFSGVVWAE